MDKMNRKFINLINYLQTKKLEELYGEKMKHKIL